MSYYIGIDLGTSALKALLLNEKGEVLNSFTKDYPLYFPQNGWSEQNPEDWWDACLEAIPELIKDIDSFEVKGIGCGGQMHGLVALDKDDNVLRPAILWNDGRTAAEVDYLNNEIGRSTLSEHTANIAFAGFTAPKLLWMQKNEPELFAKIDKIMLPKDYINYRLTGIHSCDYSDASGMLLLDVKNKCWSGKMLQICGLKTKQMPKLFESYEIIGTLTSESAALLSLPQDVKVAAGAGDNAAAAIGTGTIDNGECNISLGTSGTIFISSNKFAMDPHNALHTFAHADGNWHLMGCILSAASCNKWLCNEILKANDYSAEQAYINDDSLGRNTVFFLPYLMGERSPINDTNARGSFIGLSLDTSRADIVQAVLEGVAFAIRDCFEIALSLGININKSKICGGGAKSPLWKKIISNVLNIALEIPQSEEGPGYGAAILAMVGCGLFDDVQEAVNSFVRTSYVVEPDPVIAARYENKYKQFKSIYPALKSVFTILQH